MTTIDNPKVGESMDPTAALEGASPEVLWFDTSERPEPGPSLPGDLRADLCIVGAGYTGLWAALAAKEDDPSREVVVIDAGLVGGQASGRNGGFCSASLTHGLANGLDRFPHENDRLVDLGRRNLAGLIADIRRYGIDCELEETGNLLVAHRPWLVEPLREFHRAAVEHGEVADWLDRDAVRAEIDSPTFEAGVWQRSGEVMLHPSKLAWGLAEAARSLGVRIFEHTSMDGLDREGAGMVVRTSHGTVRCGAVVLGTNAFRSPVRTINRRVAPVYDHVLATEPLSTEQLARIGWANRQGLSDTANLFHYSRLTADNRILWGGYDAVYHFGNRIHPSLEQRDVTHRLLAEHFQEAFPQLEDVRFTHRWGGVIDTCTRFSVSFGTAFDGRVAYATGYTGLGVGATRFGARVCVDLLYRSDSELLGLDLVRRAPIPFPPEPVRWMGIEATRRAIARADANRGRRGPWLRTLDRLGLGFDS